MFKAAINLNIQGIFPVRTVHFRSNFWGSNKSSSQTVSKTVEDTSKCFQNFLCCGSASLNTESIDYRHFCHFIIASPLLPTQNNSKPHITRPQVGQGERPLMPMWGGTTTPFGTSSTTSPATAAPWLQSRRVLASCHPALLMTVTLPFPLTHPTLLARTLPPPPDIWVRRLLEAWDFSICSALYPSIWSRADWDSGTVFQHVESRKSLFHNSAAQCASTWLLFRPLVIEAVGGGWSGGLGFLSCWLARESRRSSISPPPTPASVSLSASQQPSTGKTCGRSSDVPLMVSLPAAPASASGSSPRISLRLLFVSPT